MTQLTADAVKKAIMKWPGLYETEDGRRFRGQPVSYVPRSLRDDGWRNVSRTDDEYDLKSLGLEIVTARYVGGVAPARLCRVVVAESAS